MKANQAEQRKDRNPGQLGKEYVSEKHKYDWHWETQRTKEQNIGQETVSGWHNVPFERYLWWMLSKQWIEQIQECKTQWSIIQP